VRPLHSALPRRAILWWLGFAALATLTGFSVRSALGRAEATEARWGPSRTVLVATHAIAPGGSIDRAHATRRRRPKETVPSDALSVLPHGRVAVAAISAGEVVLASRVSGERSAGLAARLPAGTRALMVPLELAGLPVRVGDRVDLLATGGGGPAGDLPVGDEVREPERPVAEHALVVAVQPEALVVAVPRSDAPDVAAALGQGPVVPALTSSTG